MSVKFLPPEADARVLAAARVIGERERLKPTGGRALGTAAAALEAADRHDDRITIDAEDATDVVVVLRRAADMIDQWVGADTANLRRIADELYGQIGRTA